MSGSYQQPQPSPQQPSSQADAHQRGTSGRKNMVRNLNSDDGPEEAKSSDEEYPPDWLDQEPQKSKMMQIQRHYMAQLLTVKITRRSISSTSFSPSY